MTAYAPEIDAPNEPLYPPDPATLSWTRVAWEIRPKEILTYWRSATDDPFLESARQADQLLSLPTNWNSYGAEAPSREAVQLAKEALYFLRWSNTRPTRVRASARGGVVLCFDYHPIYASLEFFNAGDVVLLKAQRPGTPETRLVPPDLEAIRDATLEVIGLVSGR